MSSTITRAKSVISFALTFLLIGALLVVLPADKAYAATRTATTSEDGITTTIVGDDLEAIITRVRDGSGHGEDREWSPKITTANGYPIGDDDPLDGVVSLGGTVGYTAELRFRGGTSATTYLFGISNGVKATAMSCVNGINIKASYNRSTGRCAITVPAGVVETIKFDISTEAIVGEFTKHTPEVQFGFDRYDLGELTFVSAPFVDVVLNAPTITFSRGEYTQVATIDIRNVQTQDGVGFGAGDTSGLIGTLDVSELPTEWSYFKDNPKTNSRAEELVRAEDGTIRVDGLSRVWVEIVRLDSYPYNTSHDYDIKINVEPTSFVGPPSEFYPEGIPNNGTGTQPGDGLGRDETTLDVIGNSKAGRDYPNNDWARLRVTTDAGTVPGGTLTYGRINVYTPGMGLGTTWDKLKFDEADIALMRSGRTSAYYFRLAARNRVHTTDWNNTILRDAAPGQEGVLEVFSHYSTPNEIVHEFDISWTPAIATWDDTRPVIAIKSYDIGDDSKSREIPMSQVVLKNATGDVVTDPTLASAATITVPDWDIDGNKNGSGSLKLYAPIKFSETSAVGDFQYTFVSHDPDYAGTSGVTNTVRTLPPPEALTLTATAPAATTVNPGQTYDRKVDLKITGFKNSVDPFSLEAVVELSPCHSLSKMPAGWELVSETKGTDCLTTGDASETVTPTVLRFKMPEQAPNFNVVDRSITLTLTAHPSVNVIPGSANANSYYQVHFEAKRASDLVPSTTTIKRAYYVARSTAVAAKFTNNSSFIYSGQDLVLTYQGISGAHNSAGSYAEGIVGLPQLNDKATAASRGYTGTIPNSILGTSTDGDFWLKEVKFNTDIGILDRVWYTTDVDYNLDTASTVTNWLPYDLENPPADLSDIQAFKIRSVGGGIPGKWLISPGFEVELTIGTSETEVDDRLVGWGGRVASHGTSGAPVYSPFPLPLQSTMFDFQLRGYVWNNNKGLTDFPNDDSGLGNVTLQFTPNVGEPITTTTDETGYYEFFNPPAGTGRLEVLEGGPLQFGKRTDSKGNRVWTRIVSASYYNYGWVAKTSMFDGNFVPITVDKPNYDQWANEKFVNFGFYVDEPAGEVAVDVKGAKILETTDETVKVEWDVEVSNVGTNKVSPGFGSIIVTGESAVEYQEPVSPKSETYHVSNGSNILYIGEDGKIYARGNKSILPHLGETDACNSFSSNSTYNFEQLQTPDGVKFKSIASGTSSCFNMAAALTEDNELYAWGRNATSEGMFGPWDDRPSDFLLRVNKVNMPEELDIVDVSIGYVGYREAPVVLTSDGKLYSWDKSYYEPGFYQVHPTRTFRTIKSFEGHTMYIDDNGTLYGRALVPITTATAGVQYDPDSISEITTSSNGERVVKIKSDLGVAYSQYGDTLTLYSEHDGKRVIDANFHGGPSLLTSDGTLYAGFGMYNIREIGKFPGAVRVFGDSSSPGIIDDQGYVFGPSTGFTFSKSDLSADDYVQILEVPVEDMTVIGNYSPLTYIFHGKDGKMYALTSYQPFIGMEEQESPDRDFPLGYFPSTGPVVNERFNWDTLTIYRGTSYEVGGFLIDDINGTTWTFYTNGDHRFGQLLPGNSEKQDASGLISEPLLGRDGFYQSKIAVAGLDVGESQTVKVVGEFARQPGVDSVAGLQFFYDSPTVPISRVMPDGYSAPVALSLPDADDVDLRGILGNPTCSADPEQSALEVEDMCDQVPAVIAAADVEQHDVTFLPFNDLNNNGLLDSGEEIISDVSVGYFTNDVVQTPVTTTDSGATVFVNSGTRVSSNAGLIVPGNAEDGSWSVSDAWTLSITVSEDRQVAIPLTWVPDAPPGPEPSPEPTIPAPEPSPSTPAPTPETEPEPEPSTPEVVPTPEPSNPPIVVTGEGVKPNLNAVKLYVGMGVLGLLIGLIVTRWVRREEVEEEEEED